MPIKTACPECDSRYSVPDHLAGKRIRCKKCGGAVAVPAAEDDWDFGEIDDPAPFAQSARPKPAARSRKKKPFPTGLAIALGGGATALAALVALVTLVDWNRALGAIGMSREERAARAAVEVMEGVGNTLATVQDAGSARAAAPRLKALGEKLAAVISTEGSYWKERKEKFEKLKAEIESLPPEQKQVRLGEYLAELERVRLKYEPRRVAAQQKVQSELQRVARIDVARDEVRLAMAGFQDAVGKAASEIRKQQFDAMAAEMKDGPAFIPPGMPTASQMQNEVLRKQQEAAAQVQQQIASAGAANTVTFVVVGVPSGGSQRLTGRVREITGAKNISSNGTNGTYRVVASPVATDVKSIAGQIDFGEVLSSDPAARVITIRWTAPDEDSLPPPPPTNTGGFDV